MYLLKDFVVISALAALFFSGCLSNDSTSSNSNSSCTSASSDLAVSWRPGSTAFGSTKLVLTSDCKWTYSTSSGTWSVSDIQDSDWTAWNTASYSGPTKKITLSGWDGSPGSGPLDPDTDGSTYKLWVIYDYNGSLAQIYFLRDR
jgi:hypothetical protein